MHVYDLLIVGAGPAGLATAIAASKRQLSYLVLEKGALVNTILHFPRQMVFFTTPELLEIGGLPFTTPYEKPTRAEALRYYRRVADAYDLQIAFGETVHGIVREAGADGREATLVVRTALADGTTQERRARTVLLATGAYDLPNRLDVPGEDLPHVSHYYTEPHPYWRKPVVIVGGQNSAAEAALDLHRSGAHVTIVHRQAQFGHSLKYWVKPDIENRVKEGSVSVRFNARVLRITDTTVTIEQTMPEGVVEGDDRATEHAGLLSVRREELPADAVFLLTGYRSDVALLAACGVRYDPVSFEPDFNPETFESNVSGLYLAGQVITGRQSGKIFIENGRFHGERVVEVIAQRLAREASGALLSRA